MPQLLEAFNRRKRGVHAIWHLDETYIKVRVEWLYLYLAIDKAGATVEFFFRKTRDLNATKRSMCKALGRHQISIQITINGFQIKRTAILEVDLGVRFKLSEVDIAGEPINIRNNKYMNNRIKQDHRSVKSRAGPMLGFKSENFACIILSGIVFVHMIRRRQLEPIDSGTLSFAGQFDSLAAEFTMSMDHWLTQANVCDKTNKLSGVTPHC
jgi:transposase-like protein